MPSSCGTCYKNSLLAAVDVSLSFIPAMIASRASVPAEDSGLAAGLVNTTYQVGSALGLAAMTAVAHSYTNCTALTDFHDGFHAAFYGAAIVTAAGGLVSLVFIRTPKQH